MSLLQIRIQEWSVSAVNDVFWCEYLYALNKKSFKQQLWTKSWRPEQILCVCYFVFL
jgi:hypothetical protein